MLYEYLDRLLLNRNDYASKKCLGAFVEVYNGIEKRSNKLLDVEKLLKNGLESRKIIGDISGMGKLELQSVPCFRCGKSVFYSSWTRYICVNGHICHEL